MACQVSIGYPSHTDASSRLNCQKVDVSSSYSVESYARGYVVTYGVPRSVVTCVACTTYMAEFVPLGVSLLCCEIYMTRGQAIPDMSFGRGMVL